MKTLYLVVLLGVVLWKGYYAWLRARNCYRQDRQKHDSLREYLLGNGATQWQSLWPFYRHALQRAVIPMKDQWRLWLSLLVVGMLVWLIF